MSGVKYSVILAGFGAALARSRRVRAAIRMAAARPLLLMGRGGGWGGNRCVPLTAIIEQKLYRVAVIFPKGFKRVSFLFFFQGCSVHLDRAKMAD